MMEVLMEEGATVVTSSAPVSRASSTTTAARSSPAPSAVVVTSAQGRTNGTVVFASPAQVKQLNVVPSATTQALAVQQPGGGVSIVHVSIPNQPMHVQSVIQPNQQSVIQAAGGAAALQTVSGLGLGKNVILVNKGSVIHSADGDAGVHPVQLIPASKLDASGEAAVLTAEDDSKKRREILARRPSYRKILNELSSTEAQGAVASLTADSKDDDDDPDTITVAGTQYHTTAGLLKVVPASAIQLAAVTQEGSLQGLQTLTMTNAGSGAAAGTIVQYAQGQDGQFFVPVTVSAADLQAYQIRTTGSGGSSQALAQSVVMAPAASLQTQQSLAEEASRKRELRLLKNRDAAKECRRKKKEYIKCLENRVAVLENQNKALIDELKSLKELYCQKNE
ncbi:cyclic AMP-dependent transcription factor ATF-1-like isoform X1 [Dermacentor silvarum]|uniref:cyclic AMP-dependent transcription factor ATF-1-like isoform X1 n=2 Tax=Dermacentor silvarum TaxID=543639 RepID=UPI002100D330|nr:cyclic AMP-dependent transcription factor ATF-1-like isoform X1 [Dermacentor silvarum]